MPAVPYARQISVTAGDRRRLTKLASCRTAPYQQVIRARIVLEAANGSSSNAISRRLGVSVDTVRCWRGRYAGQGLAGLADHPRSGRPPRLTPLQIAEVKALACQLPAETGVPLSRWSCPELAGQAMALAGLSGQQRAVLVLRYCEDLPEAEVASLLGCSAGTVKTHAYRGLRALRESLGDLDSFTVNEMPGPASG